MDSMEKFRTFSKEKKASVSVFSERKEQTKNWTEKSVDFLSCLTSDSVTFEIKFVAVAFFWSTKISVQVFVRAIPITNVNNKNPCKIIDPISRKVR